MLLLVPIVALVATLSPQQECSTGDPLEADSWHLDELRAPAAWCLERGGGSVLAVIDSGVSPVPDLPGLASGWNVVSGNAQTADSGWHGTVTAGVAAAFGGNGLGGAGVAPDATILPVRITNAGGFIPGGARRDGLIWAADNGARVALLFAPGESHLGPATRTGIDYFVQETRGVVLVASGNQGLALAGQNLAGVVMVGGVDRDLERWPLSNYGRPLDLVAPAVDIWGTEPDGTFSQRDQTSSAMPAVAGVFALVFAKNPGIGTRRATTIVYSTARDLGPAGWDVEFGWGIPDARAAVEATPPPVSELPGEH